MLAGTTGVWGVFGSQPLTQTRCRARDNDLHRVEYMLTARQGMWSTGDCLSNNYMTGPPVGALRVAAGFFQSVGGYHLKRADAVPPPEVLQLFFPEVDKWTDCFESAEWLAKERVGVSKNISGEKAFLRLFRWLKVVICQDAVLLRRQFPQCQLWSRYG